MLQSGGGSYAAPSSSKIRLPAINPSGFIGSLIAPKPTASSYYSAPTTTIPKPVSVTPKVVSPPAAPSVSAAQATAPPDVDYKAMLEADPFLAEQIRVINAQRAADEAWMTEQRRRALIQFGEVPDLSTTSGTLLGNYNADINDTTRQLAGESTRLGFSTTAGINKAFSDAQSQYLSSLAARGMIRSGALGQHLNEATLGRDRSRYGAMQELTDYMISLYQNYLGQVSQGDAAAAAATKEALDRLIAQVSAQEAARKAAADKAAADAAAAAAAQQPPVTQVPPYVPGGGPVTFPLSPQDIENINNNVFPPLDFAPTTNTPATTTPIGTVDFTPPPPTTPQNPWTQYPPLDFTQMGEPPYIDTSYLPTGMWEGNQVGLSPEQMQDITQNQFPEMSFPTAPATAPSIGTVPFTPPPPSDTGWTNYPEINFTQLAGPSVPQTYGPADYATYEGGTIPPQPSYIDTSYRSWLDYNAPVYDPMSGYRTTQSADVPYVEPPPDEYTAGPGPDYGPSGEEVQLAPEEVQMLQEIQQQVDPGGSDWDLIQMMLMMGGGY